MIAGESDNPAAARRTGAFSRAPARWRPAWFTNPFRRGDEQVSLFGEILDWMLAPLLLLWPMSVTITYLAAQSIANVPFDRTLSANVELLADYIREARGQVTLQMPIPVGDVLRRDTEESATFVVFGLNGELVAGDRDLPLPPAEEAPTPGHVRFRSTQLRGTEVRVAYAWVEFPSVRNSKPVLIQVAETLGSRFQLANEIIRGVIIPQFVVLPIAVALVWFALSRGLAPLNTLQAHIRSRGTDDLSPINTKAAPDELAPLVSSFNEMLSRLTRSIQMQKRFLADAAHQMKTPLAGLRTQAELALRETDPEQLRSSLKQIAESSQRSSHLIDQLLALARVENLAASQATREAVNLAELARAVVQDFVPLALDRGIDLGYEQPEGDANAARIVGLPIALRELAKNLVDNALLYTPRGGAVTVRVQKVGEIVRLEVEDTGPGIPESERKLVFERFYRVLGSGVDGSGLGLAIVREIAEQHGSLPRIDNNPNCPSGFGPGTRVMIDFVHLPAVDSVI
jgi:two-component system, OmpR family, sensor histidine kinase TctE